MTKICKTSLEDMTMWFNIRVVARRAEDLRECEGSIEKVFVYMATPTSVKGDMINFITSMIVYGSKFIIHVHLLFFISFKRRKNSIKAILKLPQIQRIGYGKPCCRGKMQFCACMHRNIGNKASQGDMGMRNHAEEEWSPTL